MERVNLGLKKYIGYGEKMVVGKKEKSDVKYQRRADIIIGGKRYKNRRVYGDRESPQRRDIFVPSDALERYPGISLPKSETVVWMGNKYPASLSFRYGQDGNAIPVYQFFVK